MKRKIQSVDATVTEHEETNSCPLKFAKSTNGLVVARNGVEDRSVYENLSCYECDEPLYYRRDHKRTRNGIEHDVNACFVHNRDNDTSRYCNSSLTRGESYYHRAAKDAVSRGHAFQFQQECLLCKKMYNIVIEGRATLEFKWRDYVLDVAFIGPDGILTGAIEIYYSHEIGTEKREALSRSGIAWVEVAALAVLNAVQNQESSLSVMDCAMSKKRCWECVDRCDDEERSMRENIKIHLERLRNTSNLSPTLEFGKYRGLTLKEIFNHDPGYIKWLSGYSGHRVPNTNKPIMDDRGSISTLVTATIQLAARCMLNGYCIYCLEPILTKEKWRLWCNTCYRTCQYEQ